MDKLKKEIKKSNMVDLNAYSEAMDIRIGDSAKLCRTLIKSKKVNGVITSDENYFLGHDEVINRVDLFKRQGTIENYGGMLDILGIDREFLPDVLNIANLKPLSNKADDDFVSGGYK